MNVLAVNLPVVRPRPKLPSIVIDQLVPKAIAQGQIEACFWHRGVIPSSWTAVPPPPEHEQWLSTDLLANELIPGALGTGTAGAPVCICGDASAGKE
eukprot:2348739-Pyramimonas_sp.AAC.1